MRYGQYRVAGRDCQDVSHFYRPQTKFAKVMFLHVSVILSTGGGSASSGEGAPGTSTAAGGTHPTGMHSCDSFFFTTKRQVQWQK